MGIWPHTDLDTAAKHDAHLTGKFKRIGCTFRLQANYSVGAMHVVIGLGEPEFKFREFGRELLASHIRACPSVQPTWEVQGAS
jgi:hypothetical protein